MPELAEIESVRKRSEKSLKGKKIKAVEYEDTDRYLFAFAKAPLVRKALVGAKIQKVGRKGKYFWFELNRKPWVMFHLGMSGNIAILPPKSKTGVHTRGWGGPKMWSEGKSERRLWFSRLLLTLDDGTEFAITDPRRFGRMWILETDPLEHPRIKQLGYDPLIDFPSPAELHKLLAKRKLAIKALLLNQKLFAGIGNWLADEILFQAGIAPARKASELSKVEVKKLHSKILSVVKKAVSVDADYERFPNTWLFEHRWGKNAKAQTANGHKIIHETIGGRTNAWVHDLQS